jgi:hypothetical protein
MANFNLKVVLQGKHATTPEVKEWNINNKQDAMDEIEHQISITFSKYDVYKKVTIYLNDKLIYEHEN